MLRRYLLFDNKNDGLSAEEVLQSSKKQEATKTENSEQEVVEL